MPTVRVDLGERSYDVVVEKGLLADAGRAILSAGLSGKAAIITDSNVAEFHGPTLLNALTEAGFSASMHCIPAGESSKSMSLAEDLCAELADSGHDRRSFIVALGGGVVGDLAGFVASIFYRGVPFVQIPTTIVAQVDSSVGGKTGVNLPQGKNLLGAFHQPALVLVDPDVLQSLPDREYREGYAEVIKHAAIRDAAMVQEIAKLDPDSREVPAELIARNIAIKARIVEADEHETKGLRALLNLGHTIGHGIEAAVPYGSMLHGEAISLGLRAALFLSLKHAGLSKDDSDAVLELLRLFRLPLLLDDSITTERVLEKLGRDKKFEAGNIRFVLMNRLGDAFVSKDVSRQDLADAIEHLRSPDGDR
ncbi:3-dehydroquinate synthase [Luteolibacter marinus]|uniref:3-dehydroquinate synthase n=1 Tax=Luteolibacter marinus TaxID=2776705 RepID=UPI001867AF11|nr:3-dehydroquinate synthase [Luteolibacter marinus]